MFSQRGMFIFLHSIVILSIQSQTLFTLAQNINKTVKYEQHELLICRKCGGDVVDSGYLFNKISPSALVRKKSTLFGKQNVTVQTLVNPYGIEFDIITTEKARCDNIGKRQGADSWFPGYTWRLCTCPFCTQHIGWTFEQLNKESPDQELQTFHGIILSNVLGENFTDSLIMMPPSFRM